MKNILTSLALILLLATPALAQTQTATEGYTGPGAEGRMVSVSDIKNLDDDTMVRLTGRIESKTGDEKYLFNDGTGSIAIEIDDDLWNNRSFGPTERVEIYGEVDKGILSAPEIDVKRIIKVN